MTPHSNTMGVWTTFVWQAFSVTAILVFGLLQRNMACHGDDELTNVRLMDGRTVYDGRVEVLHSGLWGTVCDDRFNDKCCSVVCRQLGHRNGTCLNEDGSSGCQASYYSESTLPQIWLDELLCLGFENSIDQCQHSGWGETNCQHKEDAGCICEPISQPAAVPGVCDAHRHRIHPFDRAVPGRGRVEVQNTTNGMWGLVCDDVWNDLAAQVFCTCLGYKDRQYFRAVLYPHESTSLPMLYDVVRCSRADAATKRNLWDCEEVQPASGLCDPVNNAAGVTCEPLPTKQPNATHIPAVSTAVTCNTTTLVSCFQSTTNVALTLQHFVLEPSCRSASRLLINNTLCYQIPLHDCQQLSSSMNATFGHYCYDVIYSPYSSDPQLLMMSSMTPVTSRVCCVVAKTGRVVAEFTLTHEPPAPHVHTSSHNLSFSMHCYHNETFTGEQVNGLTVTRGQHVYCLTRVNTWDDQLLLVVDNCYFSPYSRPSNATYHFVDNRCPTTDALDLLFYSSDRLSWGVRFAVPKYQAFNSLYVACSAYICDSAVRSSEHCDRSCVSTPVATTRARRRRRRHGPADLERHQRLQTQFTVADDGFGPLIDNNGQLRLVRHTRLRVDHSSSATSSASKTVTYSVTSVVFSILMIVRVLFKPPCAGLLVLV